MTIQASDGYKCKENPWAIHRVSECEDCTGPNRNRLVAWQSVRVLNSRIDYSKWLEQKAPRDGRGNPIEPIRANSDKSSVRQSHEDSKHKGNQAPAMYGTPSINQLDELITTGIKTTNTQKIRDLYNAIGKLTSKQQQVIKAIIEGLPAIEMAHYFKVSEQAISNMKQRALKALQKQLEY